MAQKPKRRGRSHRRPKATKQPGPMTPATVPVHAADRALGRPGRNQTERLDEALDESFPASDPPSTRIE